MNLFVVLLKKLKKYQVWLYNDRRGINCQAEVFKLRPLYLTKIKEK